MPRLEVVTTTEPQQQIQTFEEACQGALKRLLAKGGQTMMFITETPEREIFWNSVPNSPSLERGMILDLAEELDLV